MGDKFHIKAYETIGDKIRALLTTDEGIADILLKLDITLEESGDDFTDLYCDGQNNCITEDDDIICTDEMRKSCIERWLRKPAVATPYVVIDEDKIHSGLIEED